MLGIFLGVRGISLLFLDQGISTTPKLLRKNWGIEFLCVFMSVIMQRNPYLYYNEIILHYHEIAF